MKIKELKDIIDKMDDEAEITIRGIDISNIVTIESTDREVIYLDIHKDWIIIDKGGLVLDLFN